MADYKQLALFCHKMEQAIHAGFDIRRALLMMQEESPGQFGKALERTYDSVCGGRQLYSAMRKDEDIYTADLVNAMYIAEQTGRMELMFNRMSKRFDAQYKTRRQLRSAMIYPCIVLLVFILSLLAVAKVWGFVSIAVIIILGIATAIGIMLLLGYGGQELSRRDMIVGNALIRMPFIGKCILQSELADFASNMAIFYECGMPVEQGLEYSMGSIHYTALRDQVKRAANWVRQGNPLSEALQLQGVFPRDLINMLKIGEASGSVDTSLEKIAEYYRLDVEHRTQILMTMLRQ